MTDIDDFSNTIYDLFEECESEEELLKLYIELKATLDSNYNEYLKFKKVEWEMEAKQ